VSSPVEVSKITRRAPPRVQFLRRSERRSRLDGGSKTDGDWLGWKRSCHFIRYTVCARNSVSHEFTGAAFAKAGFQFMFVL
jgi:hypothetical protein